MTVSMTLISSDPKDTNRYNLALPTVRKSARGRPAPLEIQKAGSPPFAAQSGSQVLANRGYKEWHRLETKASS